MMDDNHSLIVDNNDTNGDHTNANHTNRSETIEVTTVVTESSSSSPQGPRSFMMKEIYTKYPWPLTLPRCDRFTATMDRPEHSHYTLRELEQVEIFVHKAISTYHHSEEHDDDDNKKDSNNITSSSSSSPRNGSSITNHHRHKAYDSIIETIRDRNNHNGMLGKLFIALRTGGNGTTLQYMTTSAPTTTSTTTTPTKSVTYQQQFIKEQNRIYKHAKLIHHIVRFMPFYFENNKKKQEQEQEQNSNNHDNNNMKNNQEMIIQKEPQQQQLANDNDYYIADAYFHLIIALVSSNAIFLLPVLHSLWQKCTNYHPLYERHKIEMTYRYHATFTKLFYIIPKASHEMITIMTSNAPVIYQPIATILYYYQQCFILLRHYKNSSSTYDDHHDHNNDDEESSYYYIPRSPIYKLLLDVCIELDVAIKLQEDDKEDEGDNDHEEEKNNKDEQEKVTVAVSAEEDIQQQKKEEDNKNDDYDKKSPQQPKRPKSEFEKQQQDMIIKLDILLYLLMEETEEYCQYNRSLCDPRISSLSVLPEITSSSSVVTATNTVGLLVQQQQRRRLRHIFDILFSAFKSNIIMTHQTKFVQFLLFHLCGYEIQLLSSSSSSTSTDHHEVDKKNEKNESSSSSSSPPAHSNDDVPPDLIMSSSSKPIPTPSSSSVEAASFVEHSHLHSSDSSNNSHDAILLYRLFATKLIDMMFDPTRSIMIRQTSSCYLASYICRAQYVCTETAWEAVVALLRWAETYTNKYQNGRHSRSHSNHNNHIDDDNDNDDDTNRDDQCNLHALFYTVCQSAFYIMCFRGKEIMDWYQKMINIMMTKTQSTSSSSIDHDMIVLQQMNIGIDRWTKLCHHPLKPLKYCLESVRMEFLHLSKKYHWIRHDVLHYLFVYEQQRYLRHQRIQQYNNNNNNHRSNSSNNNNQYRFSTYNNDNSTNATDHVNSNNNCNSSNHDPMKPVQQEHRQRRQLLLEIQERRRKNLMNLRRTKRLSSSSIISIGSTFSNSSPNLLASENRNNNNVETSSTISIEKERISGGIGGLGHGNNPLDSFFPFDPYLLRRSLRYIEPYYRHWKAADDDDDDEHEEQGDVAQSGEHEFDVENNDDVTPSQQCVHEMINESENDKMNDIVSHDDDGRVDAHHPDVDDCAIDNNSIVDVDHLEDDNVSIQSNTSSNTTCSSEVDTVKECCHEQLTISTGVSRQGRKRTYSEVSQTTNQSSSSDTDTSEDDIRERENNNNMVGSNQNINRNSDNNYDLILENRPTKRTTDENIDAEVDNHQANDDDDEDYNNIHQENLIYFETNEEKQNWTAAMNRIRSYSIENGSW